NHECLQVVFCFQAEDGIRDRNVTGVQTCALPIYCAPCSLFIAIARDSGPSVGRILCPPGLDEERRGGPKDRRSRERVPTRERGQIGRASCRERVKNRDGRGTREAETKEAEE